MKTRTRFLMLDNVPTLPSLYYTWQSSWKAQVLHLQVLAGRPSILKPCPQRNPNHHNNTRQSTFSLLLSHFEHAWELLTLPLKLQKWIITLFLNFWGICSTPKLRAYLNQILCRSPFILFSALMESTRHTTEGRKIINELRNGTLNRMMDSSEKKSSKNSYTIWSLFPKIG